MRTALLLDVAAPPRSVKDVALQLGFANNGRFAAAYNSHFGEMRSDTLARTRSKRGAFPHSPT